MVVGSVASTLTLTDFGVSVLPSLSVERYWIVWLPSSSTVNGPV